MAISRRQFLRTSLVGSAAIFSNKLNEMDRVDLDLGNINQFNGLNL
jgi:hypothetical protein